MTTLTTSHDVDQEREASISWLHVKILDGTAGLDPFDQAVMIVEVTSPDRAWRLDLIGHQLNTHPWVRPDRSTCIRVRAIIEADVRVRLGLDGTNPPVLADTPIASRSVEAQADAGASIIEMDRSRRAGRSWSK